jgi:hypothetical protein
VAELPCSVLSRQIGEPLAGTTAVAPAWLCVEQPGPWGREALTESHLDDRLAQELARRADDSGVRITLIRRPGKHPDRHRRQPRQVFVAHTRPGTSWLEKVMITDSKQLLDLDLRAIAAGVRPGLGALSSEQLLMVCTNSRRDMCCALHGRPIVAALQDLSVWECSHTGGHRFAPTGVLLPTGYCYGRMDVELGRRLLSDPDVITDRCRGRSTWEPAGQVAELAVRELAGVRDLDALSVGPEREQQVQVSHVDGRRWTVTVVERTGTVLRAPKCGAEPVLPVSIEAVSIATS